MLHIHFLSHNVTPQQATTARTLIGPAAAPAPRRLKRRNPYAVDINTNTCRSHGSSPYPRIDANINDKDTSVVLDAQADIAENADMDDGGRDDCMDS